MASRNSIGQKVSVEQLDEQDAVADEPALRPTVALERQATIDSEAREKVAAVDEDDHPHGMTLAAEEQWAAREAEKARTHERRATQSTLREQGSRVSVARGRAQARTRFDERAASVDPTLDPQSCDPREELAREELAAVNQQAHRIAREVRDSSSRAAVSRHLAERVAQGDSVLSASVTVLEAERTRSGTVIPIGELEAVTRAAVSIQGTVTTLWDPAHPSQQQVGLLADETGTTKFTAWRKSDVTMVREGDHVRFRDVARNWYDGRVSVALTGTSRIVHLDD